MSMKERDRRAGLLSALATDLSRRRIAHAAAKGANALTVETNLKRWSGTARDGAIDAPPDWIFDEIARLKAAKPQAIAVELREAAERNWISPALALRAALAIEGLLSRRED
jgi:hypothetical protein